MTAQPPHETRSTRQLDLADETTERGDREAWARTVRTAMQSLPADERNTLLLIYFRGLTQAQAAAALGTDAAHVRRHVATGLSSLVTLLTA